MEEDIKRLTTEELDEFYEKGKKRISPILKWVGELSADPSLCDIDKIKAMSQFLQKSARLYIGFLYAMPHVDDRKTQNLMAISLASLFINGLLIQERDNNHSTHQGGVMGKNGKDHGKAVHNP